MTAALLLPWTCEANVRRAQWRAWGLTVWPTPSEDAEWGWVAADAGVGLAVSGRCATPDEAMIAAEADMAGHLTAHERAALARGEA